MPNNEGKMHKCPICNNMIAVDKWIGPASANIISIACVKCAIQFQRSHYSIKCEALLALAPILSNKKKKNKLFEDLTNNKIGNIDYPIDENYLNAL